MKQFFKHFGSKARISQRLPPPRFKTIIEPFAGSAAYSVQLAKPHNDVLLFDTDERVCTIWDFLIQASESDILALPVKHFHDGGDIRDLNLPRPQFLFLQRWLAMAGTHSYSLAPCLRGDDKGHIWCELTRARIARQLQHIRHWKIRNEPHTAAPDIEAHWHVDPPYQSNAHGFREYKCEPLDYQALAQWCLARKGDITVHEQEGADWLPFEPLDSRARSGKFVDGAFTERCEVYWTNEKRDKTGNLFLFDRA